MNINPTTRQIVDAMIRADYRRQLNYGRWRVVWWPKYHVDPQRIGRGTADRRAVLRQVTGLKRPPYSEAQWQEIVMLLPAMATAKQLAAAWGETAEALHARFDSYEAIGDTGHG